MMNPQIASTLAKQHHDELTQTMETSKRAPLLKLPRWRVSWSRTMLSPASSDRGSSWVIIISATRSA
jgi:hypothetical protein